MHSHVQTEGLIPLSVGYPSERIFPIEDMRAATEEVMATQAERALQYSDVRGTPELAEQVAALSAARGEEEDTEDIVITSGATQGLSLAMRAILRPGDVVACEDPSFMSVIRAIRAAGAKVQPVPGGRRRPRRRRPRGAPRPHRDPRARDPAAPSQPDRPRPFARAARAPARAGAPPWLLHRRGRDLRRASLRGDERPSLRADAPAHAIYTDSLSKTVGGGLRAGWVIASGPVLDRIIAEKRSDDIHTPVLNQLVAAEYLAQGHYPAQLERAREPLPARARGHGGVDRAPPGRRSRTTWSRSAAAISG